MRCRSSASAATSARTRRASERCDDSNRRTNALIVPIPVAGPAQARDDRVVVGDPGHDEVDEFAVGAQRLAVDPPAAVARRAGRPFFSARGDVVHDHRVLLALVLGVGEHERQQLVGRELLDRPEERVRRRAGGSATSGVAFGSSRRGGANTATSAKAPGIEPEIAVLLRLLGREPHVLVVEEEEVLALHVEDQRLGVGARRCRARPSGTARRARRWRTWSSSRRRRCPRC